MERLFDGMDQENSKTQGGKGQIRKIQKNKKERMEERKRRDFYVHGGSHTGVFFIVRERACATLPQENPLEWGPPLQQNHRYMVQSIFPPERTQKLPGNFLETIVPELTSIQEIITPSIQMKHLFIVTVSHI